jgi:hypothetical protein
VTAAAADKSATLLSEQNSSDKSATLLSEQNSSYSFGEMLRIQEGALNASGEQHTYF